MSSAKLPNLLNDWRLMLMWQLYDMQLSVLLSIPPLFSIAEINASLPMDEDITRSRNFTDKIPNFRVVLQGLLSTGTLEQPLGSFALSVIAHTLYRYAQMFPWL